MIKIFKLEFFFILAIHVFNFKVISFFEKGNLLLKYVLGLTRGIC
jgi:hypothetical protein